MIPLARAALVRPTSSRSLSRSAAALPRAQLQMRQRGAPALSLSLSLSLSLNSPRSLSDLHSVAARAATGKAEEHRKFAIQWDERRVFHLLRREMRLKKVRFVSWGPVHAAIAEGDFTIYS